jgi:hypothetical protein
LKLVVRALLLLAVSLAHLNPFALAEAGRTQLSASWEWSASPSELRRAPSVYDVQSIALVEVCATDGAVAGRKQPGDLSEWSALPSAEPEGASTTPSVCVGATEAAPQLVYRGGSRTADNMTPRPGIDDTGLSTFDTPGAAAPNGGKVQVIDTSKLKCTVACPDSPPPGHVSVRPPDVAEIPGWAGTRGTGQVSPYTQDILDAVVDEIRLPRP